MIDKNFYLENLSAFDILIQEDDRQPAQEVIFRVYSILQRDKIWLRDVATPEEILPEDVEFLTEVEEELKELDEQYDFRFDDFYKLMQQEIRKLQGISDEGPEEESYFDELEEGFDTELYSGEEYDLEDEEFLDESEAEFDEDDEVK